MRVFIVVPERQDVTWRRIKANRYVFFVLFCLALRCVVLLGLLPVEVLGPLCDANFPWSRLFSLQRTRLLSRILPSVKDQVCLGALIDIMTFLLAVPGIGNLI